MLHFAGRAFLVAHRCLFKVVCCRTEPYVCALLWRMQLWYKEGCQSSRVCASFGWCVLLQHSAQLYLHPFLHSAHPTPICCSLLLFLWCILASSLLAWLVGQPGNNGTLARGWCSCCTMWEQLSCMKCVYIRTPLAAHILSKHSTHLCSQHSSTGHVAGPLKALPPYLGVVIAAYTACIACVTAPCIKVNCPVGCCWALFPSPPSPPIACTCKLAKITPPGVIAVQCSLVPYLVSLTTVQRWFPMFSGLVAWHPLQLL